MSRSWTKEEIAALIDGSVENDQDAEALQRILDADPEASAYAEEVRRTNALFREAFEDPPVGEALPPKIEAAIFGRPDNVTPFKPRRPAQGWMPSAIAASLALAIGLSAAFVFEGSQQGTIAALGDAPLDGPLHAALEHLPSGATSDDGVQPMLTFWDGQGRPCREFDVLGELPNELEFGVACRNPAGQWHVEIVVAAPVVEPGPEGYAVASGAGASALDAMLDALGAGPALSPKDEAGLLERQWTKQP